MKAVDANPGMYIDFSKENNREGPKFKVGYDVRISKYKNIVAKSCVPNWSEENFVIKKVKNTVILNANTLLEHFMKNNYKKQNKKNLG